MGLTLLWLWHRLEAVAGVPPLAWELPYAAGVGLKSKAKKPKNKTKKKPHTNDDVILAEGKIDRWNRIGSPGTDSYINGNLTCDGDNTEEKVHIRTAALRQFNIHKDKKIGFISYTINKN